MLIVRLLELLAEHTDARRIDVLAYSAGCQVLSPALAALAATKHGVSRAGRPDKNELSEEETQWVIDASRELPVDFISVSASKLPGMARGAHDFWYSHPWVSTDVSIQLLFEARPADRGLEAEDNAGTSPAGVWYFPDDYPQRATQAIDRLQARGID